MADYNSSPEAGDFAYATAPQPTSTFAAKRLTTLTNVAGAVVSLALVAGIGVWGYKLLMRDVSGIPVVQAAAGDMRVRPEDPGGQLAQHQGLSVNEVAAEGVAAAPADKLRLAPKPIDLADGDQIIPASMVAPVQQAEAVVTPAVQPAATAPAPLPEVDVAAALNSGAVDDLVAQLTAGVTPLSENSATPEEIVATVTDAVVGEVTQAAAVLNAPGVRQSKRPRKRPAGGAQIIQASLSTTAPATAPERDASSVPAGTRLAQLGAFDSEAVAREQWDVLSGRFGSLLDGKTRIVQKATSGGRVFYRLRALGFADIADARRFCSALVAENADCIPVVTR